MGQHEFVLPLSLESRRQLMAGSHKYTKHALKALLMFTTEPRTFYCQVEQTAGHVTAVRKCG